MKRNSLIFVLVFFLSALSFNILCTQRPDTTIRNVYGQAFAGSLTCKTCHKDIYDHFVSSAHYRDSRPASAGTIRGSFDTGSNVFVYHGGLQVQGGSRGDAGLQVEMEMTDSGAFQTAVHSGHPYRRERFDIVIGSARKGQSYLYWKDKALYQLPVSYAVGGGWCISPGYTADSPFFDRRVPAACLECHATNARTVFISNKDYGDFFDRGQLIYGVDCERCHGPGEEHVRFQTMNPDEKTGRYIVNTGRLSRQQRLDACALCHSGSRYPLKPPFSYRVGDRLDDFSQAKYLPEEASTLDVHGNQYGLLGTSKCFISSGMDCSTCHRVHVNEEGDVKQFSQRCLSCHNGAGHVSCKMPATAGLVLSDNCIDCHMPVVASQKLILKGFGGVGVRTHHIAIYAEFTRAYLEKLRTHDARPAAATGDRDGGHRSVHAQEPRGL
jgi:hypothetical protein